MTLLKRDNGAHHEHGSLSRRQAYIYLQRMGIDIWCLPQESAALQLSSYDSEHSSGIQNNFTQSDEKPVSQQAVQPIQSQTKEARDPRVTPPQDKAVKHTAHSRDNPVAAETLPVNDRQADLSRRDQMLRFSLVVQEVVPNLFLFCELEDPLAPDLSERESELLKGILRAVGKLCGNQTIYISHNVFRWPVVDAPQSQSLFSDELFAIKALEGLIRARLTDNQTHIIFLSDQLNIKDLSLPEDIQLYQYASLAKMADVGKNLKGQLWKRLLAILQ